MWLKSDDLANAKPGALFETREGFEAEYVEQTQLVARYHKLRIPATGETILVDSSGFLVQAVKRTYYDIVRVKP